MDRQIEINLMVTSINHSGDVMETPTTRFEANDNNRISFFLLMQIKQKEQSNNKVQVDIIKFEEPERNSEGDANSKQIMRQDCSKFSLLEIPLDDDSATKIVMRKLLRDIWKIRKTAHYRIVDVPIPGNGDYAIVAYLREKEDLIDNYNDIEFLDCAYFTVSGYKTESIEKTATL